MKARAREAPGLADVFARETGAASATILDMRPLAGGAVRRHWLIAAELHGRARAGRQAFVLRTDGATPLGLGLDLASEFVLLQRLYEAGMPVPPPVLYCDDRTMFGAPFHLTELLPGTTDPGTIVGAEPNDGLAERLGRALAALHRIEPSHPDLAFLEMPPADPAQARLSDYRRRLDAMGEARPAAEWGIRWLLQHAPAPARPVLCHGDFRTGNYLVHDGELAGVLDWEFAGWGDPDEDIGWFCSRCWRFGASEREAGGIGSRAAFYRGYEAISGRRLAPDRLRYWEAMAALKWLVIALLQRDRFLVAGERSLDLALTGRQAAECEYELLQLVGGG